MNILINREYNIFYFNRNQKFNLTHIQLNSSQHTTAIHQYSESVLPLADSSFV
jgi:hypothetical protein